MRDWRRIIRPASIPDFLLTEPAADLVSFFCAWKWGATGMMKINAAKLKAITLPIFSSLLGWSRVSDAVVFDINLELSRPPGRRRLIKRPMKAIDHQALN